MVSELARRSDNIFCTEKGPHYFCKTACGKDDSLLKNILFAYTSELDTSAPYRRAFLENNQWKVSKSIPYKYNV